MGFLAAAPVALTVASSVLGAAGSIMGGVGAKQAANYRAQVAKNNALIAEQNAEQAAQEGAVAESNLRMKTSRMLGAQKAAQGASGVDVGFGSAVQVREADRAMGDFDALTLRYNTAKESANFHSQAADLREQGRMEKKAGKKALLGSFIGAASSLTGGLSSAFGQAGRMAQVGAGR